MDSALKYLEMKVAASEKTSGEEKIRQFQNAEFSHQQQKATIEETKKQYRNNVRMYGLIAGLCVFLLLTVILWRNNKQKQKAFALLQKQKAKTEQAMQELKSTQSQLIQSEKMASLGELTAGIAHEIQNPLNFVNNFSEVNKELLEELKAERLKPNAQRDEQLEEGIITNVIDNQEKINHHGKRAEAIVKGMLQHSRTSGGQKELTDISLADEYLRLAYHGLRAKDKSFNATFKTDFDDSIGKINVVPQDIGRVLLNLINNAFYAVSEKQKNASTSSALNGYEPTVTVTTKRLPGKVELIVIDNGNGIPQSVKDKIFQPFFTTKPSGQGTGLGLSLSYDIVTKGHGGTISVESKQGAGTTFTVVIPTNT
jgi:signal transduction histidine kinase